MSATFFVDGLGFMEIEEQLGCSFEVVGDDQVISRDGLDMFLRLEIVVDDEYAEHFARVAMEARR